MISKNILFLFPFFIFFSLSLPLYGQYQIYGNVSDTTGKPLTNVQILLFRVSEKKLSSFTFSGSDGNYALKLNSSGDYNLEYRSLGYKTEFVTIKLDSLQKDKRLNIVLKPNAYNINEVIKYGYRPIDIKRDTIVYNVLSFTDGTERVVEDIIKKLPGINVDDNGKITFKGKEVEKVMVDGVDFFGKGYRMVTRNVHASAIEKVEAISRYGENPLLKEIDNSEKVALNLKLSNNAHKKLFGNIEAGLSPNGYHDGAVNLMNFAKTLNSLIIAKSNSIGNDPVGNFNELTNYLVEASDQSGKVVDLPEFIINLEGYRPSLRGQSLSYNTSHMFSLNEAIQFSHKSKLTITSTFNKKFDDFKKLSFQNYSLGNLSFNTQENYLLSQNRDNAFIRTKLESRPADRIYIQATSLYTGTNQIDGSNTIFNSDSLTEGLENKRNIFSQNIAITKKLNSRTIFQMFGNGYLAVLKENFNLEPMLYSPQFPEWLDAKDGKQNIETHAKMLQAGIGYKYRAADFLLLESELGGTWQDFISKPVFILTDESNNAKISERFSVESQFFYNSQHAKLSASLIFDSLSFNLGGALKKLTISGSSDHDRIQEYFFAPNISASWHINKLNSIIATYSFDDNTLPYSSMLQSYIITGYSSVSRGVNHYKTLSSHIGSVNYSLGTPISRFYMNTRFFYSYSPKYLTTNSYMSQNLVVRHDTIISGKYMFMANVDMNYYFKRIKTNAKVSFFQTSSRYGSFSNGNLYDFEYISSNRGFELRSSYSSLINYHIGYYFNNTSFKGQNKETTSQRIFCNVLFKHNEELFFDLRSQVINNAGTNIGFDKNNYFFIDALVEYRPNGKPWSLSFIAHNLLNKNTYEITSITDYSYISTQYQIFKRFFMLMFKSRL